MTKRSVVGIKEIARSLAGGDGRLENTLIKEILHGDILRALQNSPLARKLVFQGGTALRLCYGNPRYSEDLDFVRSTPIEADDFARFKTLLKASIETRYGLGVEIKAPNRPLEERTTAENVAVHRWTARIAIENPGGPGVHKINIEVADVPAYDPRPRMLQTPYEQVEGSSPLLLIVSSEAEILADKIIALAGRRFLKARDVWDLKWLKDRGVDLNTDWVARKAADYHLASSGDLTPVRARLVQRADELARPEVFQKFVDEMSRFLGREQSALWLDDPLMTQALLMDVSEYVTQQARRLGVAPAAPDVDREALRARLEQWRTERGVANEDGEQTRPPGPKPR